MLFLHYLITNHLNHLLRKWAKHPQVQQKKLVPLMVMWMTLLAQIDGKQHHLTYLNECGRYRESGIFLAACCHVLIWIFCDMICSGEL